MGLGLEMATYILKYKMYNDFCMYIYIYIYIYIKQYLSNIWSSVREKAKQHWGWVEKKALLIKKACSIKL